MKRLKILFLIFFTSTLFVFFSCEKSYQYNDVGLSFEQIASDFCIAFSKNTPADIINKWQTVPENMKNDGTYDAIQKKWFLQ
jgi:ABC-type amino acid transport substrate-binding protein